MEQQKLFSADKEATKHSNPIASPSGIPIQPNNGSTSPRKTGTDVVISMEFPEGQVKLPGMGRNSGGKGGESPDSASLYSDEIPSGYNSGEQYDTLSTGYMSGEAYELPDTRMDMLEPSLDVIEEHMHPAGHRSSGDEDDGDIFMVPPPPPVMANAAITGMADAEKDQDSASTSSSSEAELNKDNSMLESGSHASPCNFGSSLKNKFRKKITTYEIPMENSPLTIIEPYDDSDAAATGGYRAVPSDTDTSALDSDANAIMTETGTDSGDPSANTRPLMKQQSKRAARRLKKKMQNHDEAWFSANDNKYWRGVRMICFWGAIMAMLLATIVAGVLIYKMPKNCDPSIDWYLGTVTMDVSAEGAGQKLDVLELKEGIPFWHSLGIQTIHLKDLTKRKEAKNISAGDHDLHTVYHPTNRMIELAKETFGETSDYEPSDPMSHTAIKNLTEALHMANMTLMVQVPVVGTRNETVKGAMSLELQQTVETAIKYFMERGADGIFLAGLEHFAADSWVAQAVVAWKNIIDRYGTTNRSRILMTSYKFAHNLDLAQNPYTQDALEHISLLDATLELEEITENDKTNFTGTIETLKEISAWDAIKGRPWINWNFKSMKLPLSNAALALHMLLPGTINIAHFHHPEQSENASEVEPVFPASSSLQIQNMTSLRAFAIPILMNGNYKRCHCDEEGGTTKETNFIMHEPIEAVVQLERFYSRRHRYVLVANFGLEESLLTPISRIYSGGEIVLDTSNSLSINTDVKFKNISLPPGEAIVVKLPK